MGWGLIGIGTFLYGVAKEDLTYIAGGIGLTYVGTEVEKAEENREQTKILKNIESKLYEKK